LAVTTKASSYYQPSTNSLQEEKLEEGLPKCTKWAVVTTIFEPSAAVEAVARIPSWCLVIVGDAKGPKTYNISYPKSRVVYLNEEDQLTLASTIPFVSELPWNHFGRKNAGYVYAIMRGAKVVWDFDDDNLLLQDSIMSSIVEPYLDHTVTTTTTNNNNTTAKATTITVYEYEEKSLQVASKKRPGKTFNPYPIMGAPSK